MSHNTLGRFGGWALMLLAATQGLLLGLRPWPCSVASDPWLTAGDHSPVLALSASLPEPTEAFARLHGWDAEVVALAPDEMPLRVRALTRRTPWVFALDEGGRVVAEGHGGRIAELVPLEGPWLEVAG